MRLYGYQHRLCGRVNLVAWLRTGLQKVCKIMARHLRGNSTLEGVLLRSVGVQIGPGREHKAVLGSPSSTGPLLQGSLGLRAWVLLHKIHATIGPNKLKLTKHNYQQALALRTIHSGTKKTHGTSKGVLFQRQC